MKYFVLLFAIIFTGPCYACDDGISFIGKWQAMKANNAYILEVTWNNDSELYEGILIKNGEMSEYVGFQVGELVWKATPDSQSETIIEEHLYRSGVNGVSSGAFWNKGQIYLDKSNCNTMVTTAGKFKRVEEGI